MRTVRERQVELVARLRSGKYEKCKGRLRRGGAFCALGVGCDILADEELGQWENDYGDIRFRLTCDIRFRLTSTGSVRTSSLHGVSALLLGFDRYIPMYGNQGDLGLGVLPFTGRDGLPLIISSLNDDADLSFNQIADLIEHFFVRAEETPVKQDQHLATA